LLSPKRTALRYRARVAERGVNLLGHVGAATTLRLEMAFALQRRMHARRAQMSPLTSLSACSHPSW
jgi:hypothetical protein